MAPSIRDIIIDYINIFVDLDATYSLPPCQLWLAFLIVSNYNPDIQDSHGFIDSLFNKLPTGDPGLDCSHVNGQRVSIEGSKVGVYGAIG